MIFDDNFDYSNIPSNVLHDAVNETLSAQMLIGGDGGKPYNFRCPICGDSKKHPHKRRGYVLYNDNNWVYWCHNKCGMIPFINFLKDYHVDVYRNVIFHGFKQGNKRKYSKPIEKIKNTSGYKFKDGELISILDNNDVAKVALNYCISRRIPEKIYSKWYVCLKDNKFLTRDNNGKILYNERGNPLGNEYGNRLIIPYYTYGGYWMQFDARDLSPKSLLRYRNLENADRELYNIDFLNVNEPFFLVEGAIDSTFIRNSVAFGGTKHLHTFLEKYPLLLKNTKNGTIIWDNDDAGRDELYSNIKLGFNWFDWQDIKPTSEYKYDSDGRLREIKDINDAVLYSDVFSFDNEGFINIDSLKTYIKNADGAEILITLLYGNRDKMKRKRRRQIVNNNVKKKDVIPYF